MEIFWAILEVIGIIANVTAVLVLPPIGWDIWRGKRCKAKYDGKEIAVPSDQVKEEFRRATLAEISRINNGDRVELDMSWKGYTLVIETKKGEQQ